MAAAAKRVRQLVAAALRRPPPTEQPLTAADTRAVLDKRLEARRAEENRAPKPQPPTPAR